MHKVTRALMEHYEGCLAEHGANAQGMDWGMDEGRLARRFAVMCRAMGLREEWRGSREVSVTDAGCGCGLFLGYLKKQGLAERVRYVGVDASERMIEAAKREHPEAEWRIGDILSGGLPRSEWVCANGVLTERREVGEEEMERYAKDVMVRMYETCEEGIVVNVMSGRVNFRNEKLFYWDAGEVLEYASRAMSRHVAIYHDTELYDYFVSVRKRPWTGERCA